MKRIVIFGYTLDMGGAEKALINILNILEKHYKIDLILLKNEGVLKEQVPSSVNVISIRKSGIIGTIKYALFRYISIYRKYIINRLTRDDYSIACAFMEGRAATWLVDMKQNCKKIAWIHNDVAMFNIGIGDKEINKTYHQLSEIVIVSQASQKSFCEKYKIDKKKTRVIYNLIDEKDILRKSELFVVPKEKFTFINVAKMRPQKRHDRLIECAEILRDKGYDFNLWLLGDGPMDEKVAKLIREKHLENVVTMWGLCPNPYPYVKASDCFVMSSDHEGYPLSLLESLLLGTPAISTNVSGAKEIIGNNKYGLISDVDTVDLARKMEIVLNNNNVNNIRDNLESYRGKNKDIVRELKKVFEIDK